MHFLASNGRRALHALLILTLCAVAWPALPARAQVDTVVIDVPTPPDPPTRKRIVIGGSGVRIEDEEADSDTSGADFDFDFEYEGEERSDDIVKVGESVFVPAGDVVAGDVVVFGGNAIIEGTVVGSVVVLGGEIRARGGSEIKGDIVSIGGTIQEDEDVVIRGEKILIGGVASRIGDELNISARMLRILVFTMCLFVSLVLYFITMLFLRGRVIRASEHLSFGLLKCFGAGVITCVLVTFAMLIVMIPLIITIIGIPLAVILGMSWFGVMVLAGTVFVYALGRTIAARMGSGDVGEFTRLAIGLAVLTIPSLVGFVIDTVGGPMPLYVFLQGTALLVWFFGFLVGLGAIVLSRFGTRPPVTPPPLARSMPELAPTTGV